MWCCIKSVYQNGDWTHTSSLQKEFPSNVSYIEIHELKNPDQVDHGFILFHFGYNECDQIQFFIHKDEALQQFESKVHQYTQHKSCERYESTKDLLLKMSTIYLHVNKNKVYAGDRWVIQELYIK